MLRLIYLSELRPSVNGPELAFITQEAARHNHSIGVSGMLAVEGRRVCQILEGEPDSVSALFAKIERDPRHTGVVEIDRREITERKFGRWSMVHRPMIDVVTAILAP